MPVHWKQPAIILEKAAWIGVSALATGVVFATLRSYEDYRKFQKTCQDRSRHWTSYYTQAIGGPGGTQYAATGSILAGQCRLYQKGTAGIIDSTHAATFAAGVDLSGSIGLHLSAQTGYSTELEEIFLFSGLGHPLCGTQNAPGSKLDVGLLQVHSGIVA
jgi:hypothetical protein